MKKLTLSIIITALSILLTNMPSQASEIWILQDDYHEDEWSFLLFDSDIDVGRKQETECLAKNMYHEARGEGDKGMIAVGYVTMNRVEKKWHGMDSICGVVYDPHQFSWTSNEKPIKEKKQWERAVYLAKKVLHKSVNNPIGKKTHYWNPRAANPDWSKQGKSYQVAGNHIFTEVK